MHESRKLRFTDGRVGRHGRFGDPTPEGVYTVEHSAFAIGQSLVDEGLAAWDGEPAAKPSKKRGLPELGAADESISKPAPPAKE